LRIDFSSPDYSACRGGVAQPFAKRSDSATKETPPSAVKSRGYWHLRVGGRLSHYGRPGRAPVASGGVIYMDKGDEAAIKVYFDYAKACGMPMIIAGATPETLPIIEKLAKQYNIRIAVHNHGPEDKIFPNPQAALKLMRNMDPRIGVCMDVGHTVRTGVDLIDTIRAAGDRLLDIHVKDLRDLKDAKTQCPVGEGAMPIVPMFKELIKMRYRGLVALEYEIDAANPLPGMQKSFDYMRGVLTKLRG